MYVVVVQFQTDAVPAPDVHLSILQNRLRDAGSVAEKGKIVSEIEELLRVFKNYNNLKLQYSLYLSHNLKNHGRKIHPE